MKRSGEIVYMDKGEVLASVNVMFLKEGKVLLSKRANTGWNDGMYCLPGGHCFEGERPRWAAARETLEEVGLDIRPERFEFVCVAARVSGDKEYVAYEFSVELSPDEIPENTEPDKCSALHWSDPSNLPGNIIDDFRQIINKGYTQSVGYLELGYN